MYKPDPVRGWNYEDHQADLRATVRRIDERYLRETANEHLAASNRPNVFEGFAVLYDVPHWHKGRLESFDKGCFSDSLFDIFFLVDHNFLGKKLGDQDDGSLEVIDTDVGLAFRLKLGPGHLERIEGRDEMSVSYFEQDVEVRMIDGETVRVIKKAALFELSAVIVGAIRKTHAVVRDASAVGLLKDDVSGFASDGAAEGVSRALRGLMRVLQ